MATGALAFLPMKGFIRMNAPLCLILGMPNFRTNYTQQNNNIQKSSICFTACFLSWCLLAFYVLYVLSYCQDFKQKYAQD